MTVTLVVALATIGGAVAGALATDLAAFAGRRAVDGPITDLGALPRWPAAGLGAATGLGFGLAHPGPPLLHLVPTLAAVLALAWVDLRSHRLPTALVRPAVVGAFALVVASGVAGAGVRAVLAGVLGALAMGAIYLALHLISPSSLGFGDVRLSVLLGLTAGALGPATWATAALAPFLVLGLPALVLRLVPRGRLKGSTALPFGPAMVAGWVVAIVLGAAIGGWYAGP